VADAVEPNVRDPREENAELLDAGVSFAVDPEVILLIVEPVRRTKNAKLIMRLISFESNRRDPGGNTQIFFFLTNGTGGEGKRRDSQTKESE
jgi:hypothetical protein